jgi:pimeloyl-ACP methyl ester carboxylesterase
VILNHGLGDNADSWRSFQSRLSKRARVCSWDRPGYGTSDPSDQPLNVTFTVSQLEALLSADGIAPPYIVVGHSYGGFEALMFAHRNPKTTTALVLVDPSFPHQDRLVIKADPSYGRMYQQMMADRVRISRECLAKMESKSDNCEGPTDQEHFKAYIRGRLSVYENWDRSSDQIEVITTLGSMPLYVLTAALNSSDRPPVHKAWHVMHERYAQLSSVGIHRAVPGSGHKIQDDRPDVLVATVMEAIAASRSVRVGRP